MAEDDLEQRILRMRIQEAQKGEAPSVVEDVAKSAGVGAVKGAAGVAGTPVDALNAFDRGYQWLVTKALEKLGIFTPEQAAEMRQPAPGEIRRGGADDYNKAIQNVAGPYYKPKTTAGEYAQTTAEFATGAALAGGPAGALSRTLKFGVLPGMVSETAGQATKGTAYEPYARVGGAAVGTLPGFLSTLRSNPGRIARDAVEGATPEQLAAAKSLMDDAARMGTPITLPEAVQQATNGATRLGDVQRVVEQSARGAPVLRPFMAARPAANRKTFGEIVDRAIGPAPDAPFDVAPKVQAAAKGELSQVRQAINAEARPFYKAAEAADDAMRTVGATNALGGILGDPVVQQAISKARSGVVGKTLAEYGDDSIRVLNEAKKAADDMAEEAMRAGRNNEARLWSDAAEKIRTQAASAYDDYGRALAIGAEGRQTRLAPLERAPTGQLAAADAFPEQARVIFNSNPLPGSDRDVFKAVQTVAKADPDAARGFVRMYLEQQFNETTQALQGGANQFGGAKFRATVAGNDQQAKNLYAAIRALPGGEGAWKGFGRFLEVLQAQGRRQPVGSQTEFNRLLTEQMKGSGGVAGAGAVALSPGTWPRLALDKLQEFRYGANNEALARLFTDPDAVAQLQRLAKLPPDSRQAQEIVAGIMTNRLAIEEASGGSP